ncbi:unnamed protein product [Adineta ricciae]|uniref:Uncharacterized protein n=1 Tax=Adineta ricciae TaxID=249248 RepID=A0A815PKK4_ADIRI|nr:unnamed protein product [Adineta ricciae]
MPDSLAVLVQQQREHLSQLQNQLLTSPQNNISVDFYKELMVTYLYLSKVTEAKFLWESLSPQMKAKLKRSRSISSSSNTENNNKRRVAR